VNSRHVREVVTSSEEGGASLNILSGFVAGNFSAFWLGMAMMALMAPPTDQHAGLGALMMAPPCSLSAWWRSDSWAWAR
jgi:K(+)-stimulated pyrophosphate-energized sodium pump